MNLGRYSQHPSRRLALEAALGAVLWRVGKRFLRKQVAPGLFELAEVAEGTYSDSVRLLTTASWGVGRFDENELASLKGEFEAHSAELAERYRGSSLEFPREWAVESGTSFLLYALARILRPEGVVEIGVANGQSSFFILRALQQNGSGCLHSFDIAESVGGLVSGTEREAWDLVRLDPRSSIRELGARLAQLPPVGLCFHDADHGYLAQYTEFESLWSQLEGDGVLVCDDVDASFALIDFTRDQGRRPDLLVDNRKVLGVLARAQSA